MTVAASNAHRVEIVANPLPSWYSTMTVNQFKNIAPAYSTFGAAPGTSGLEVNDVSIFSYSGGFLISGGIYNGATFIGGTFLGLHGGGHGAYNGNEIVAIGPLESDSIAYYRACPANPAATNTFVSGNQPASQHTYSHVDFLPSVRKLIVPIISSRYQDSGQDGLTFLFNFNVQSPNNTNAWSKSPTVPDFGSAGGSDYYGSTGCYDSAANKYILTAGSGQPVTGVYDVASNTWTKYPASGKKFNVISYSDRKVSAIDPVSKMLLITSDDQAPWALDARNPANEYFQPAMSGDVPQGNGGICFDPVNNRFVYYQGGNDLTFIPVPANPYQGGDTWVCTKQTFAGDTAPTIPTIAGSGMWNRIRYVPRPLHGYIACAGWDRQVTFFKLA